MMALTRISVLTLLAAQAGLQVSARALPSQAGTPEQPFVVDSDPILHGRDVAAPAPAVTPASNTDINLTQYVNIFVGTEANGDPGDVFAGASVPYGMAKATINVEGYAPAGYVWPSDQPTRGVSPLHDSGTGSSSGSYGNFCIMPVLCDDNAIDACPTLLDDRKRMRRNHTDHGRPGYFTTTLDNGIKIEVTSTRRSTLERYTFPAAEMARTKSSPYLVLDWTNDSPGTFRGGEMKANWEAGRLTMNGTWLSSWGPGDFPYHAFQCVDLKFDSKQTLGKHAFFGGNRRGYDSKRTDLDHWVRLAQQVGQYQAGAVVGFKVDTATKQDVTITVRRGVSFASADNACHNMETEISNWNFDATVAASQALWEDKLQRIQLDPATPDYVRRLFYTSFYRTFLSPNNATGDGPFPTTAPYFDGMYCTWDTYRTLFPFLSLSSPGDFAQIVETYIDGWRKEGWLPECRANQIKGFVQGSNHGVEVLADFAVKYAKAAESLGVNTDELYQAMQHDLDVPSPQWEYEGRQAAPYQLYGYIPFSYIDPVSVGEQTREASRSLEYAFGDFTAAMTALALGKPNEDVQRYAKASLNYSLNFDHHSSSDGFTTFVQRRYANGTFQPTDPTFCSPLDTNQSHACSLQAENDFGVYESSSWEYSFYAPHDRAGLVELMGGKATFEKRLDHFFDKGYYGPGNEPSFDTPTMYHFIGKPWRSVQRVREVVHKYFSLKPGGIPGNDDNGAMASLLGWYLLGLYPTPGTKELLVLSPFMPGYTIDNPLLGKATVTVRGFDERSIGGKIPTGVKAYVQQVLIDGKPHSSRCRMSFDDLFPGAPGAERRVEIVLTDREIGGCGAGPDDNPASLSTGGFLDFKSK
ncbi:Glycosyl hydrolase family 92 [Kalmanozyma brasiliensis GHG001]|uniref:Glycosyl hydrolase n=1 Tax=Kalmanozyma brasiliensis (strain GHG001) TaxID=1365824 RepID=V5F053_KALBG|nr:Glycosyl hydrolase family 92 [Kalmanozyma brasiliensis GHG001]EST09643.1 Glycosyl hydrolase family 92 [Kalmanozyma brasiliensis GHG001]